MKLTEIKSAPGFEDLIPKMSIEQQDKRGANLIMFKFLSEVENVTDNKKISRKNLAKLIGTSASNVTQLFRGSRLINLLTLAKLERVLDIEFEISTVKKMEDKKTPFWFDSNQFVSTGAQQITTGTTTQSGGCTIANCEYKEFISLTPILEEA